MHIANILSDPSAPQTAQSEQEIVNQFVKIITSPKALISAIIIAAAIALWIILRKISSKYISESEKKNGCKSKRSSFARISVGVAKYLIVILTALVVLQINGINVSSLIASLGLVSAIIGLALQDALKDIIMGVHIMSDRFFSVGDVVQYNGVEGIVISFNVRTTKIKNIDDHSVLTISNRNISEIVRSASLTDIDIPLSYEEDAKNIHSVLQLICTRIANIDGIKDCVYKGTQSFEESAVVYKIRFYCPPQNKPDLRRAAIREIQNGLNEAGIKIPYNKLDINIKKHG